jgi:hypothetical protein
LELVDGGALSFYPLSLLDKFSLFFVLTLTSDFILVSFGEMLLLQTTPGSMIYLLGDGCLDLLRFLITTGDVVSF